MTLKCDLVALEPSSPRVESANVVGVVEQSERLLCLGQAEELGVVWIVIRDQEVLSVENGRVGRVSVAAVPESQAGEVGDEGFEERRVAYAVEVWVDEVRDLGSAPSELDERHAGYGASKLAAATLVGAEEGRQLGKGAVVNIEGCREELAHGGLGASAVDGIRVAGRVEEMVGFGARRLVRSEEGADVVAQGRG